MNKRALSLVLISGACFGIFLNLGLKFCSNISLLYLPLFIFAGISLYTATWILYSSLLSYRAKKELETFLIKDSITYLPSVLLLFYIFSYFINAGNIYPGITPPQEHLMKMIFLFFALLALSLIVSLKIFVHGHFERIDKEIKDIF